MSYIIPPVGSINSHQNNVTRMDTYKANKMSNNIPPYTPAEEIITVRDLLRRLADGKVTLDMKIKI